jgi:hypothetical protein
MEGWRYLAAAGGLTGLCGCITRIVCARMRWSFFRRVLEVAAKQGRPIDPVEIMEAANPRTRLHQPQAERDGEDITPQPWTEKLSDQASVLQPDHEHLARAHRPAGPP